MFRRFSLLKADRLDGDKNIDSSFDYLDSDLVYFDSACQSLRPKPVIEALNLYYKKYNSCGDRVKYDWGIKVDNRVNSVRGEVLSLLKLSKKDYCTSFTLNTTYGLNLILSQLDVVKIDKVITSDIEHNSVFLSTISFAKKNNLKREVLVRNSDGSIDITGTDFKNSVVVLNVVSNFDGRKLLNVKDIVKKVHQQGGIVVIDAAQAMAHYHQFIAGVEADAICFSGHKMYGASLGVIVFRYDLMSKIKPSFVGGGMVSDVNKDSYDLVSGNPDEAHTIFEAGLQSYGEIIALGEAIKWLKQNQDNSIISNLADSIFNYLKESKKVHLVNSKANAVMSFYVDKVDSDLLAKALSDRGIMVRSGYFCVHYYLSRVKSYPPLVRLSLGLHNNENDVVKFIDAIKGVVR